jgi:hypothetical protein
LTKNRKNTGFCLAILAKIVNTGKILDFICHFDKKFQKNGKILDNPVYTGQIREDFDIFLYTGKNRVLWDG